MKVVGEIKSQRAKELYLDVLNNLEGDGVGANEALEYIFNTLSILEEAIYHTTRISDPLDFAEKVNEGEVVIAVVCQKKEP